MDRREFLQTSLASAGALMLGGDLACKMANQAAPLFPKGSMPRKLWASTMDESIRWHDKVMLTCLQGLVNRKETRVYFIHEPADQMWLDYYRQTFAIPWEEVADPFDLVKSFAKEISGYIVYDPQMPHSINIATTMGSLANAVPVSPELAPKLDAFGLKKIDDLTGRWENLYQAYDWAAKELLPQCHQQVLMELCVHLPHWPTTTVSNRDYAIAHKLFCCDVSASERDKADYELLKQIYSRYQPGAIIMGWHCGRDKEHESIALASQFGHISICSLHTPNLTVHSSIEVEKQPVYHQRAIDKAKLRVEDKVYIAYMATDGDAAWFMLTLNGRDWANPLHGSFKYNWGFLPLSYELLPGVVEYYLQNMKPNDYFVAGPSGATYTYPHLHPDPQKFLRLTNDFMKKCGLTTAHITNWNDRDWWQEVELPDFPALLYQELPNAVGFVRGMGESAFEKHYIAGGKPYVFCGEGIHMNSDVYQTMKDFIDACPNRPLFIYCLVNHNVSLDRIKEAMDRFPTGQVELVHLDELLMLIEKAFAEGKITDELYPEKAVLLKLLAREAKAEWPKFLASLEEWQKKYQACEDAYLESVRKTPTGLEIIVPGDFLAFDAIWHAMKLVKLALEAQGIYVNHKPTATKNFLEKFAALKDVGVVQELQELWNHWHHESRTFGEARELSDRFVELAKAIDL